MDLTQIRYFITLATTLNFTRAAEACNVTQPALTKSIQRLEEEFGGPLLLRERSHTQLTPLGEIMLPLLQRTFEAAEAARLSARQFHSQGADRLRIGLGDWVQPDAVTPLVVELARTFPALELTIRHGKVSALNEWLLGSEIDVTLTADAEGLTDRANRWMIFADPIVAHVHEAHALAGLAAIPVDLLSEHPLVGRLELPEASGRDRAGLERRLPNPATVRHRGASDEHVDAIVQSGIGIALTTARRRLPLGVVRRAIEPGTCVEIVVATIAGRPMSRSTDSFVRLARARSWNVAPAPREAS